MTTLSGLELFWVIYVFLGSIVIGANFWDAIDDRTYAKRAKENRYSKELMAFQHARVGGVFFFLSVTFFIIGFVSALSPESQRSIDPAATHPYLLILLSTAPAFLLAEMLMVVSSILSRRERKALIIQRLGDPGRATRLPTALPLILTSDQEEEKGAGTGGLPAPTDIDIDRDYSP